MKVFIAILALVGAAAANHIAEHIVPVEKAAERGIASVEKTEAMTPAQRGIASMESLEAMTAAQRGMGWRANAESLEAMTAAQRSIASVESTEAMTAAQRGIAQHGIAQRGSASAESLEAMIAAQRGSASAESLERTLSVFGAAKTARDAYLPVEKIDALSLYEKPMILALKNAEMNAVEAYLLKDGLSTVFNNPAYSSIRAMMLSGPAKVGLLPSAARLINAPEMSMRLLSVKMSPESTLNTISALTAKDTVRFPWLTITEENNLRGFNLESLDELGRYTMLPEKLAIARNFYPVRSAANAPVSMAARGARDWFPYRMSAGLRHFPISLENAYESERISPADYVIVRNAFPTRSYVIPSAQESYESDESLSNLAAVKGFPYAQRAPNAGLRIQQYPVGLTTTSGLNAAGYGALPVVNVY